MAKKYLDKDGVLYFWSKIKLLFVRKEDGKGLSTNDYTTAEKTKLSGIAKGAEVNQNAFGKASVDTGSGTVIIEADTKTDTLLLAGSDGVKLEPDIAAGKVTIKAHTHDNKDLLDSITKTVYNDLMSAKNMAHIHDNKETLDKISDAEWTRVYGSCHSHDNQDVLDATTASYTTAEKAKLSGIAAGANKYTLPTASATTLGGVKVGTNLSISNGVLSAKDTTYSAATTSAAGLMSASDKTKLNGIESGANKTIVDASLSDTSTNPLQNKAIAAVLAAKVSLASVGKPRGIAELDENGVVPSSQLPSFVDDVVEGYYYNGKFYKESTHSTVITGESGKIYLDLATNLSYRFGGTAYTQITSSDMVSITNAEIDTICV